MAEYIEREALLDSICHETCGIAFCGATNCAFMAKVCSAPAADVSPVVHGHWIEDNGYLKCPECSVMVKCDFTFFDIGNWDYCPNCGAKMDGETESNDG